MTHAAIEQPAATPSLVNGQGVGNPDTAARGPLPPAVSDLAVASSVAQAVRAVPGVVDLSPGRVSLAATYGAGQRVTGVVVHHTTPDTVILEIHVVLSETDCATATANTSEDAARRVPEGLGVLAGIANQVREVAYGSVQGTASPRIAQVDVLIDDLL